jgi:hypothetical protein
VGLDASRIDQTSFVAAAETVISEGLGVSPQLDDVSTLRTFIGTLLQHIDGLLYWQNGVCKLKLMRKENPATAIAIDASAMTEEPRITGGSMADTWNFTRLVFTDRENDWDRDAVEPYDDHANAAVQGEHVPKDIELPFITRRAVAKILARRRGIAGGLPQIGLNLTLLPSYRTLKPGDLISVTYPKLRLSSSSAGSRRVTRLAAERWRARLRLCRKSRATSRTTTSASRPAVQSRAFYGPDGSAFGGIGTTIPRLLWLPDKLKDGDKDGALIAFTRPNDSTTIFRVWTWDPAQKPTRSSRPARNSRSGSC